MYSISLAETATASTPFSREEENEYTTQVIGGSCDISRLNTAVRIINPQKLTQESGARFSWNSYYIEPIIQTCGIQKVFFISKINREPYESNPSGDWTVASWENFEINQLETTLIKIQELSKLPEKWDSYDAGPIKEEIISTAIRFMKRAVFEIEDILEISNPYVLPCPNGSIQLEWHKQEKELEIVFAPYPEGSISYVREFDSEIEEGETTQDGAIGLLRWLINN